MTSKPGILASVRRPGSFDPLALGWQHAYWAEGPEFQALGLSDNATVSTWPDEAGEHDATQGNALSSPTFSATGLAGQPSVNFTAATAQYIESSAWSLVPHPWSVVIIGNATNEKAYLVTGLDLGSRSDFYKDSASSARWRFYCGSTGLVSPASQPSYNTDPHLFVGHANNTASGLAVDGETLIIGDPGSLYHSSKGIRMGAGEFGGTFMQGRLAFVGFAPGDIRTDPFWPDFEAWVTDHYGITIA